MLVSLISAMAEDRVIGIQNRLPWTLPADMKWFRQHTLGKPILMGRKTFESFGGKPLPDRRNIIITRDANYHVALAYVAHDIDAALILAGDAPEVMVIGGENLYQQLLPRADRLYLTYVKAKLAGDAWFPEFARSEWEPIQHAEHPADEKNAYAMRFVVLQRVIDHRSRPVR
ncbi:MAG: type 3 dihydrofolate reductase [Gammaproteobacteria bacterium]|nr:type 3 dihydrofolate reductase [Gammaproteobacteria bacterium]